MTIRHELIDESLKDYETPQDILDEGGLLKELTKAVIERYPEMELDSHTGYAKYGGRGNVSGNMRNGHSQKTLSAAIENFNEHFNGIFDGHGQVPTKAVLTTQCFMLGAIFVYQLALQYRFEQHLVLCVGLKAFLKSA